MKKFVVDNRVDKDGNPDPIIQIQIEMRFREDLARDLARMTSGDQICLQMDPVQHELDLTVEA